MGNKKEKEALKAAKAAEKKKQEQAGKQDNQQQPAKPEGKPEVKKDPVKTEPVKQPAAEQKKPENKKEEAAPKTTPVETVEAEEVGKEKPTNAIAVFDGSVKSLAETLKINMTKSNKIDGNSRVLLLSIANDVIKRMSDDAPYKVQIEGMFNDMFGYTMVCGYVQMFYEAGAVTAKFPEHLLPYVTAVFANFGMTFGEDAIKSLNDGQAEIDFKKAEMDAEKLKKLQEEKSQRDKNPKLNPNDWANAEEFKAGLQYIITKTENPEENLVKAIEAVRAYRKKQEPDKKNSAKWDVVPASALFTDMLTTLEKVPSIIESGIASTIRGQVVTHKNPVSAFFALRKNMPQFSNEDIASMVMALIDLKISKNIEKENDISYQRLFGAKRELYYGFIEPEDPEDNLSKRYKQEMTKNVKLLLDEKEVADALKKGDTEYSRLLVNKLIEIDNLFKAPEQKLAIYEEKGYPVKTSTTPAAPATEEKPVETKEEPEKK